MGEMRELVWEGEFLWVRKERRQHRHICHSGSRRVHRPKVQQASLPAKPRAMTLEGCSPPPMWAV